VVFVKFKICNTISFKQNIDETHSKQPKSQRNQPIDFYNFQKNPKNKSQMQNVFLFEKEKHTLGCGFRNL
jgi:hypothetical protein